MIELSLNTLGVFVHVQRPSIACQHVVLCPVKRTAVVHWQSGSVSKHACRRRDMLRLMMPGTSMGQWANRHLLQRHVAVSV